MSEGTLQDLCQANWLGDLQARRGLGERLLARRGPIVGIWWERYRAVFGSGASMKERAFTRLHHDELQQLGAQLCDANADLFSWGVGWGARLREQRQPYEEVVISLHLFEEACAHLEGGAMEAQRERLDRLGHLRIALLALGYFEQTGRETLGAELAGVQRAGPLESKSSPRSEEASGFCGLVGNSAEMQGVYRLTQMAARSNMSVLLVGESGTGKELVARAIHRLSASTLERFVPLNCAALPASLIESELFGHRRGAFSGAGQDRRGLFQEAEGGTLFLDEITEMPVSAQAKLLRPLQEGCVRRVGENTERRVCVRIVASTNRSLEEIRDGGHLRRDLFYRLQGLVIELPPLSKRRADIQALAEYFLKQLRGPAHASRGISDPAMAALQAHHWPGNVRELQSVVGRAFLMADGRRIELEHLPQELQRDLPASFTQERENLDPLQQNLGSAAAVRAVGLEEATEATKEALKAQIPVSLKEAERQSITKAMNLAAGNKSMAARMLGISRKQLYVKLERYHL